MLSKDVKKWFNELQASYEAGKPVVVKYGSQYNNNQNANNFTKKKKYQDKASDPKQIQHYWWGLKWIQDCMFMTFKCNGWRKPQDEPEETSS